ncbi:zinc finger protein 660-like isoform X2 [Aricia agestis]|uniref:zinc finger protein 660-like isoform X1 n=1 Tax=Aricia agestis TaxID=91739 RepID=UPI001C20BB8F|nr:zinc finger protein 660-like isoform X1 [Aricia agestis]XP_041988910.1 zinc finger protein 660-like isoform X2 [Aricia agestis]
MNPPQICVNCHNKKSVNLTTNRLVTESCGHVKCMDCLVHEKSGCLACLNSTKEKEDEVPVDEEKAVDISETVKEYEITIDSEPIDIFVDGLNDFDSSTNKKPEISHITEELVGDMRQYTCTLCKKTFHARSQVIYHAYCNGQRKPYQCPECEKSFAAHSHFKYHMRVHRNERTYACDVCGDSFFQMSKLQRHKLKHTKEKKYACSQCNKAFNNVTSLRKHTLTHTEERPHACAVCGRRFRDSSNYKKHVLKHGYNPEKPCACGGGAGGCAECESRARRAQGRAHQCPRCPQAFHSRKDMRRHAAVHSDSKPFRCKVCNRRFRRKDNLERHIRNTHPEYVPAMAVECDESALKEIANPHTDLSDETYEKIEKTKLEILNPLPPIPQDIMQQHIDEADKLPKKSEVDKLSIIEANNARQSVIVEKRNAESDKKSCPENEYVHKIRKATVPLPPIDQEKFRSVQRGYIPNGNDPAPPIKNMEIYKKILYEKLEKDTNEVIQNPKMHWRKKMEQDIN